MNNTITQHGVFQLARAIAQNDSRVRSFQYWDSLTIDPKAIELPALVFKYGQVRVDRAVIYATFHLIAFDRVLPDRSNVALIPSELTTLLLDHYNQIANNIDAWGLGVIPFGTPTIESAPEDEEAVVKAQAMAFTLQLPDTACLTALGFNPVDVAGEGYSYATAPSQSWLTCSALSGCSTIITIQQDIAVLQGLTGGTSTFQCQDLLGCSLFTSLSAQTLSNASVIQDLSGITQQHTSDIATLFTLTGGTGGVVGDFLPLSGGVGGEYHFTGLTTVDQLAVTDRMYLFNQLPGGVQYIEDDLSLTADPAGFFYEKLNQRLLVNSISGLTVAGGTINSGNTNIQSLFAPISVVPIYVQNGTNITTGGTPSAPTVSVIASPSFTSVSAVTFYSGSTNLNYLLGGTGGAPTYVQPGLNITTGGTANAPIISLSGSTSLTALTVSSTITDNSANFATGLYYKTTSNTIASNSRLFYNTTTGLITEAQGTNGGFYSVLGGVTGNTVQGNTIRSGSTDIGFLFAPASVVPTYVQNGTNTTTGGTITMPTVNVVASPSFTNMTASNFISGATNLSSVFAPISVVPTYVQAGLNITTGGTLSRPVVNLSGSIALTGVTADSASITLFSARTFYSGTSGTELGLALSNKFNSLYAPISIVPTYVQNGTNTTTGGTITRPTVNLVASPSVTNLTASGVVYAVTLSGDTLYVGTNQQANQRSVRLTSNFTSSSATYTDITAFSFDVEANATYNFDFLIAFSSSGTTTGAGFSLNGPASPTLITGRIESHQGTGNIISFLTAYDTGSIANTTAVANTNYCCSMRGVFVNGPNAGTLIARTARAGTANNITVKPGSSATLIKTS